ncbi:MAG: hypothetical protein ACQESR_24960 [Planctomycetota bacterium]
MKMSFFDWVREGVRQSVLLGLSDAATEIGSPKDAQALNEHLQNSIQQGRITTDSTKGTRGRRKALGRSLSEISDEQE